MGRWRCKIDDFMAQRGESRILAEQHQMEIGHRLAISGGSSCRSLAVLVQFRRLETVAGALFVEGISWPESLTWILPCRRYRSGTGTACRDVIQQALLHCSAS